MSFDVAPLDLKAISAATSNTTKDKEVHSRKQSIVRLHVFIWDGQLVCKYFDLNQTHVFESK
jgi:hypothetical protein